MREAVAMVSGGKDSTYALWVSLLQGFDVKCLLHVHADEGSMLYHVPAAEETDRMFRKLGIPLVCFDEGTPLSEMLAFCAEEHGVNWVITGALRSDYQRMRFNAAAAECSLRVHTPLWGLDSEAYLLRLVADGFTFRIVAPGAEGMDAWVGTEVTRENVQEFISFCRSIRADPAGEGGEYESVVTGGPLWT